MSSQCGNRQETIENLQLNGFKLIQKSHGFRFGMDAVLLADFAAVRPNDVVADLGTGTGILPVLMAGRGKGSFYYAIEIQKDLCAITERNYSLNHIRGQILCRDLSTDFHLLPDRSIDYIVCNPPYGEPNASIQSPDQTRALAKTQKEGTLDGFLQNAFQLLKGRGKISLIYPAPSMLSLMLSLKQHHLEPKRFRLIYPTATKPANLVLVEAVKDAKPALHPMPPLIIRNEGGDLTNELKSIYHINEQK